jgi:predicted GNAT family acetyltransferase
MPRQLQTLKGVQVKPGGVVQRPGMPGAGARNQPSTPGQMRPRPTPGPPAPPRAMNNRPANYRVQPPVFMSDRSQQIKATIGGTPQVAGSIDISRHGAGKAFISNLQVEQQHRRRGVAAKLIEAAVSTARRQGFKAASLEARPSDNGISPQQLVAMYRRQGFKNVGRSSNGSPMMERKL